MSECRIKKAQMSVRGIVAEPDFEVKHLRLIFMDIEKNGELS
jgi:hypothetical protein